MKKILFFIIACQLVSCSTNHYYQVYQTKAEHGTLENNLIVFEDQNCFVYYNLWDNGGNIGFSIYNKTNDDLTINLAKSFFVLDNVAYPYFQNRTTSKSSNNGTTLTTALFSFSSAVKVSGSNSTSFSTSYLEKPELIVPPKTMINIAEYKVTQAIYNHCDLVRYPSKNKTNSITFTKDTSPFVFYNRISYSTLKETLTMENKFHVSEITNYPSSEMFNFVRTSPCGNKLNYPIKTFKNEGPDRFYLKYTRTR